MSIQLHTMSSRADWKAIVYDKFALLCDVVNLVALQSCYVVKSVERRRGQTDSVVKQTDSVVT